MQVPRRLVPRLRARALSGRLAAHTVPPPHTPSCAHIPGVMKQVMLNSQSLITPLLPPAVVDRTSPDAAVWCSWLALVELTALSLKYAFTCEEVAHLDDAIVLHHEWYAAYHSTTMLM